jgi:hypothetical protein
MATLGLASLGSLSVAGAARAVLAEFGATQAAPLILMVAGVLLLALALRRGPGLMRARVGAAVLRGGAGAPLDPTDDREAGAGHEDVRGRDTDAPASVASVRAVLRDAEELSALLAQQMDRQAARLERLIAEADERIRRLERLSAAAEPEGCRAPSLLRPDGADPMNRRIYALADEGLAPVEIARRLSQQTGKVELILALRQR